MNLGHIMNEVSVPAEGDMSPGGSFESEDCDELGPYPLTVSAPDADAITLLDIDSALKWEELALLEDVLTGYKAVFSVTPGCTSFVYHDFILTTSCIKTRNYRVPIDLRQ